MTATAPRSSLAAIEQPGDLIARHIDSAFRAVFGGPGTTVEKRFIRLVTGEPHPFGNFALFANPVDPKETQSAIEPLVRCGAPSAAIFTGPVPPASAAALDASGFTPHRVMPAMGVEIDRLAGTTLPPGYSFIRVNSADGDRWVRAFSEGYGLPVPVGAVFKPLSGATDASTMQHFAIVKDGNIVCTSVLFLDDGVAGIYCVATLPDHRGKGLGAHATAQPLRLARALGYRVGVLQSSEPGYPVYKRLGFADFGALPLFVRMPS